jgi:hypothetical protein
MSGGKTYYVEMQQGQSRYKHAWTTRKEAYNGIANQLGVKLAGTNEPGLVFGANSPSPPVVRISFKVGTGSNAKISSVTRICAPDKLEDVLKNQLQGARITVDEKTYPIAGVKQA